MLFVTELLQSLGNSHVNERQPRRNPSRQCKIDLPSNTASARQAIGDSFGSAAIPRLRDCFQSADLSAHSRATCLLAS